MQDTLPEKSLRLTADYTFDEKWMVKIMRRVVITGMGVVSPVGSNVGAFCESIRNGKVGIDYITKFDTTDFKVKIAAEVKDFNPADYYSEKSEIRHSDLYTQYAMGAAVQAMQDSGLSEIDPTRLGVYIGSGVGGMNTFVAETQKLLERGPSRVSPFFITMMISNMAAGAVAMRFNTQGPSMPVVSACATSGNTIGEAYRAIKYGYADAIIAGGAEATICPLSIAGFTNCSALCESNDPMRSSIPFDKERSGFVMGEGAGIVILEEYEHAKARNAKIYAEVCGYGNTCDAYHITSPRPDASGAVNAIRLAAEEAGITGKENIYINAHGTSTPMNDKTETLAIKTVFGKDAYNIPVSSTKSMTGHMLGAAGAVEVIAGTLALTQGFIPPTMGYKVQDEECDLDYVPNESRNAELEFVLSSSFGFGGHNACVALKRI
jgi:3-oxoacyl-[acyl-carrier-protein] synthase II